jgi:hypothetical protein
MAASLVAFTIDAQATTYRCEIGGRVTYGDVPCTLGQQTELAADPAPDAASRKAASGRAKADRAALEAAERDRLRTERTMAARNEREQAAIRRQRVACAKLTVRTRRASEDAAAMNGRDTAKAKTRARRAAEDEASQCRRGRS